MFVYWLNTASHISQSCQGYIGVTSNPEERFQAHKAGRTNMHVSNAFSKYKDIEMTIVFEGTTLECLAKEYQLRPSENIGWNIAIGGGLPPDCTGRKHTQKTKDKIAKAHTGVPKGISHFKGVTDRYTEKQGAHIGSFHKGKTISKEHITSMIPKLAGSNSSASKKITLVHKSDPSTEVTFGCIKTACDTLGIGYSALRSTIRAKATTYNRKGWKVIYKQNNNLGVK